MAKDIYEVTSEKSAEWEMFEPKGTLTKHLLHKMAK